jgi:hypothetical protein
MREKIFGMTVKTAPRWQFYLARIFGKTIVVGGYVFKEWLKRLWLVKGVK